MKINIYRNICCEHDKIKKLLPSQYVQLIGKSYYGKVFSFVCFPIGKEAVTSSDILKAQKKLNSPMNETMYFASCFTVEALEAIAQSNGIAFRMIDFMWTDERYNQIRGGK